MSQQSAHTPNETVFAGKSLWYVSVLCVIGATIAGWFALELVLNERLHTRLGIEAGTTRDVAWLVGGVAALVFVTGIGIWYEELRWVAVSAEGLRWHRHCRVHTRTWGEFAGVQRTATQVYVNGQHISTARGVEVRFHTGKPLVISPVVVRDFEGLMLAIEDVCRRLPGGQPAGQDEGTDNPEEVRSFGPLRLHPDGAEWDGVLRRWKQVQSYEVGHGYLLIHAADGAEFLKKLDDLGDWQPALARLDAAIGARRVTSPSATH